MNWVKGTSGAPLVSSPLGTTAFAARVNSFGTIEVGATIVVTG
jgi:hypothetical protein